MSATRTSNRQSRDAFGEAFLTHTSTSPNQQLLASLDLARRQVDIEGFDMVRNVYDMALVFRHRVRKDRLISRWFRILDESDLVPDEFRLSAVSSYRQVRQGALEAWNEAWRSDEFVLDPTRVTLYLGQTGMNGYDFREKILMDRFGIQINKTSINSVLLIFTIGVTWSSVHYLLDVLRRVATDSTEPRTRPAETTAPCTSAESRRSPSDLPGLPDFSEFDSAFRPDAPPPVGDIRSAFYAVYDDADREHIPLGEARPRLAAESRWFPPASSSPIPRAFRCWFPAKSSPSDRVLPHPTRRQGDSRIPPRYRVVGVHRGRAETNQCGAVFRQ